MGYAVCRSDAISESGYITTQIIKHLVEDALVIADLSGRNPNVFYELAIRHAKDKPVILMCQEGEDIPFDNAGLRVIPLEYPDWDNIPECKRQLKEHIEAIEGGRGGRESPISRALSFEAFARSGEPGSEAIADLFRQMEEVKAVLSRRSTAGIEQALRSYPGEPKPYPGQIDPVSLGALARAFVRNVEPENPWAGVPVDGLELRPCPHCGLKVPVGYRRCPCGANLEPLGG